MPISSSLQTRSTRSPKRLRRLLILAALCTTAASAQTLARPGWIGSGLTPNSWWRHALLYDIDPHSFQASTPGGPGDLRGITQHLEYLQSLGADALLLQHLQPADQSTQQVIDPALGTFDDFDDLVIQASRHNIRVLIELKPASPAGDLSAVARFWLSRGIAGFRLTRQPDDDAHIHQLRAAARSYVGERILIDDLPAPLTSAPPRQRPATDSHNNDAPRLLLNPSLTGLTHLDPIALRTALDQNDAAIHSTGSLPMLFSDDSSQPRSATRFADGSHDTDIAKVIATLLLTTRASSMLYFGQEIGLPGASSTPMPWGEIPNPAATPKPTPPSTTLDVATEENDPKSLLNWYRQLSVLQHSNLTLRSGTNFSLNHDDQHVLAWVRKPQSVSSITPPLVFICNLSAQPVQLSLRDDMQRLHLRGSFLRTVLRSDQGMGAMHLDTVTLPPFAVYIGELRY